MYTFNADVAGITFSLENIDGTQPRVGS